MRRFLFSILTLFLLLPLAPRTRAQIISGLGHTLSADSMRREFDNMPFFGLYKDNYFLVGGPIGKMPNSHNSDVKIQFSIAQRVTKSVLPWNTYLYLFYSQKCFWNVFENSMPMYDLNFNPGIGIAKPLFVKNKFIGKLTCMIEHESNGRDSIWSRSWNKISLAANIMIDPNLMVHGKVWIPIVDGMNNRDILDYTGLYQTGIQAISDDGRFTGGLMLTKRRGWNLNFNTVLEVGVRIFKKDNQYLFLQYYNGYGEGLFDYNKHKSQLRIGICIKPTLFSEY